MEKYSFVEMLGKGSFGAAWLVARKSDRLLLAAKEVRLDGLSQEDCEAAVHEIRVLANLHHPNIIQYAEHFQEQGTLFIIMEYADGGDLYKLIQSRHGVLFTEEEILHYFSQICLALNYLHEKNVLHRDLKSQNVFLSKDHGVKLGDFGISATLGNSQELRQTVCGTPYYFSPEMCLNQPYNHKSDVWALGCILYELATLRNAFDAKNMYSLARKILRGVYPPISPSYSPHLSHLIRLMLQLHPEKRPTAREILSFPFIQNSLQDCHASLHPALQRGRGGGKNPTWRPSAFHNPVYAIENLPPPALHTPSPSSSSSASPGGRRSPVSAVLSLPSNVGAGERNGVMNDYYAVRQEALRNKERCYREELGLTITSSPSASPSPASIATRPPLPSLSRVHKREIEKGGGGRERGGRGASSPGGGGAMNKSFPLLPSSSSSPGGYAGMTGGGKNLKGRRKKNATTEEMKTTTTTSTSARAKAFWEMRLEAEENKRRLRLALEYGENEPEDEEEEDDEEENEEEEENGCKELISAITKTQNDIEKKERAEERKRKGGVGGERGGEGQKGTITATDEKKNQKKEDKLRDKVRPTPSEVEEEAGARAAASSSLRCKEGPPPSSSTEREKSEAEVEGKPTSLRNLNHPSPTGLITGLVAVKTTRKKGRKIPTNEDGGSRVEVNSAVPLNSSNSNSPSIKGGGGCGGPGVGAGVPRMTTTTTPPFLPPQPPPVELSSLPGKSEGGGDMSDCDAALLLRMAEKLVSPACPPPPPSPARDITLLYRIETLRLHLEKEMGESQLLKFYKAMNNLSETDDEGDDHGLGVSGGGSFSAGLQHFIPLITQLIVCEDMLNENQF